jgi:hypothetical protein
MSLEKANIPLMTYLCLPAVGLCASIPQIKSGADREML